MPPLKWRLSRIVFALVFSGCGAQHLKTLDTPPDEDAGPVAPVDPQSALPKPKDVAKTNDVVATLRAPVPQEAVDALVHHLFEMFHDRSTAPLEDDLDDTIVDLDIPPTMGDMQRAYWTMNVMTPRLKATSFDQLEVDQMYRPQDVETYAREDLGQPGRPPRPSSMGPDDLLVRIPIATPRLGADVLFGDEIKLLLRRVGSTYKLHGYGEIVPR